MKLLRVFLLAASLILMLVSCRDGAMLNGPVGNYLYIAIDVPETEDGQPLSRVIHPDSATIDISLTYQNGDVVEGSAPLSSASDVAHTLDQLPVGLDVVVEVTLGLDGLDLCSSSVVMDINPGGNSADIVLAYSEYAVQGTLIDTNGAAIASQAVEVDGTTVTTDANGKFSFTVTTEDWDGYTKIFFDLSGTGPMEFARNKKNLIENRTNFVLSAVPELFVDLLIQSGSFPIEGASVVLDWGESPLTIPAADSNGRIQYGPVTTDVFASIYNVDISYKGVFVENNYDTKGSPGAIVGELTLDPYVILMTTSDNFNLVRFDYNSTSVIYDSLNMFTFLQTYAQSFYTSFGPSNSELGAYSFCDYKTGQIFIFANYDATLGNMTTDLYKMDGWNGSVIQTSLAVSPFSDSYPRSVQQIIKLNNGHYLALTSSGAFQFDSSKMVQNTDLVIEQVWEAPGSPDSELLVLHGAYQADDGTIYVLGALRSEDYPDEDTQKIFRLNSDGSVSTISTLPSSINSYPTNYATIVDSSEFASILGLFEWQGSIMTVKNQSAAGAVTGGYVVSMNNSWGIQNTTSSYDYLIPVGILPDNRFYIMNNNNNDFQDKNLLRMDSPNDGSIESKAFYTNPSGVNTAMFYYYANPSGLTNIIPQ